MLYDDLIEIARDKQQKRRRSSVHKSVPHPQFVLVLGDEMAARLDGLYQQVSSRWSSGLGGLQLCYCGSVPYTGSAPVQQMQFGQLESSAGAKALQNAPELLRQYNQMIAKMVETASHTPGLRMNRANIHVVMQPQSPLAAVVQNLIAVIEGHLSTYGAMVVDSRIYLMLPDHIATEKDKNNVAAFLEQMLQMSRGTYNEPVLLQQLDGDFKTYTTGHLVQSVMLLDEWNEYFQRYDLHGERLQLLGDLIENPEWISGSFLQTVGVQETHAGPEYWLAAAANQLCSQAQEELGGQASVELEALQKEIQQAAEQQLQGMEHIFDFCCLYLPFQLASLRQCTVDQAEEMVFGEGMKQIYQQWLESRQFSALPAGLDKLVGQIYSITALDQLSHQLDNWANDMEDERMAVSVAQCDRLATGNVSGPDAAAQLLRRYIIQNKYLMQRVNDCKKLQMSLARLCAQACRQRAQRLQRQQEMVSDLSRELQQVWYQLRDSFNGGQALPVQWLGQEPDASLLRTSLERAGEDMNACAREFLEAVADRVDLSGQEVECTGEAPLCCRLTIALGIQIQTRDIREGMSAGRTLRFAALSSGGYTNEDAGKSFLLHMAQE